jgi:hypothetical protein
MEKSPAFDLELAHRYFSADCFNRAWDYIDKPTRTPEEDETMLMLSMASFWHWSQRPDRTAGNLSVGYWQLARVHALLRQPDMARHYGQLCLKYSQGEGTLPFHLAYAYEALARAESMAGNAAKKDEYLRLARDAGETLKDPKTKQQLLADLETIK